LNVAEVGGSGRARAELRPGKSFTRLIIFLKIAIDQPLHHEAMNRHFGIGEFRRQIRMQEGQRVVVRATQQEYVRFQDAKTGRYSRVD
jgi:hypothetical protein